jgi:biopolymer transport protein ExbD
MSSNPSPAVQPPMKGPETVHAMSGMGLDEVKKKRKKKPTIRVAALNITSMMDLVLNLLLFFVLTASFAASEGILPAKLPTGGGGGGAPAEIALEESSPEIPVVVTLVFSGRADQPAVIQVEGSPDAITSYEELYQKLRTWQRNDTNADGIYKPDQSIVIRPGRDVKWSQVVDAFNALVRAKYTNIGFAPPG